MKDGNSKQKILISLIAFFSMLMCVSVGFASWIVTGGSNALALGQFEADEMITGGGTGESLDVITINSLNTYQYAGAYGFVDDDTFVRNVALSGSATFNSSNGKKCFTSFRNNKSFKLSISLSTSLTGGFSGNSFISTGISFTSDNFSEIEVTPSNSTIISAEVSITCADNNSNFLFDFSISLTWNGSSLEQFPDLSSANFSIQLEPKENE